LWAVLDEAALRRQGGGRRVMREQLVRLMGAAKLPNVPLQGLPFTEGAYAGMVAPFFVVGFPEHADADVVLLENMSGNLFLESAAELRRYNTIFHHLQVRAECPDVSVAMIENIHK